MCSLRTSLLAITSCLTVLVQAPPTTAQTADLLLFATCAGRFSALMEHQWLLSDPASDRTELQRDAMLSLVAALTTPAQEQTILNLRIAAKAVQADLLIHARFGQNEKTAALAARRSDELLGLCRSLLLG